MKIIDTRWTPKVNIHNIRCDKCDSIFDHRTDRWTVRCPVCGEQAGLNKLREEYTEGK